MEIANNILKTNMKPILESLDEPELTEDEVEAVLAKALADMRKPSITYKEKINFNEDDDIQNDFDVARNLIMKSMDKTNKLSDLVFDALAVDTSNLIYLQLASETIRNTQVSVKTLSDLYNSYHKLIQTKKKNRLIPEDEKSSKDELPAGLITGSHQN